MHPLLPLMAALALALTACSKTEAPAAAPAAARAPVPAPVPAGHPPAAQVAAAVAQFGGKLLQVQQGGGDTFAEVASRSGLNAWVTGMQIDLEPGDTVTWSNDAVKKSFTAKALGRTFERITFASSVAVVP